MRPWGKNLGALDDHLVRVAVPVVAGLGEDGDGSLGNSAAVFIGHNLAHEAARGLGNGVQNGLGQAVTQGGVQPLTVYGNGLHVPAQVPEGICLPANQDRLDVAFNQGDKLLRQEQGIPAAGAAVLHGCAVAPGDLPIGQHQHHGNGLARLPHRAEALGHRIAGVEHAVMACAGLNGPLIVKVKPVRPGAQIRSTIFIFTASKFRFQNSKG